MLYRYKAVDQLGREVTGLAFAPTSEGLHDRLRDRGRFLLDSRPLGATRRWGFGARETVFYELGSLVSAGVTLAEALSLLRREVGKHRPTLDRWQAGIEAGKTLSRCVAESPEVNHPMIVKMLEVGEATGEMALCLRQIAGFYKDLNGLRRKLISALIYPCIVIFVSMVAVFVLTFYVIPIFLDMFRRYQLDLPVITEMLLTFSGFLEDYGLLVLIGLAALAITARFSSWHRRPIFFALLDRLPLLGRILGLYRNLTLLRNLTNLLRADIRVHDGVNLLRGLFLDPSLNSRVGRAADRIVKGDALSFAFGEEGILSPRDHTLLKIGEETGHLAEQVAHLEADYARRLDLTLARFLTLFEPAMIILLSAAIGFILIGLYLPLFDILGGGQLDRP